MGRTRTFDRDTVLAIAGNVFRQRGYKDVSIKELEAATGLASGSIYNAFGDKAGLFKAALEYYVRAFVGQRIAAFAGDNARLEDLERLFLSVLEPPMSDGHGCLVNNSVIEFDADSIAAPAIAETLTMVRGGIGAVLRRELGPGSETTSTTRLLLLYHGILTLSRGGVPFDEMAAAVKDEFVRLRALRKKFGCPPASKTSPSETEKPSC